MVRKKGTVLFVVFLLFYGMISLIVVSSSVYAADVAYILKDDRFVKPEILNAFSEMNLTVELIEDSVVLTKNLSKYKLVFVDDAILSNTKTLAIYNYNSVIINSHYGFEWGLTDADGVSQLASNVPLQVRLIADGLVQVYTQAKFSSGISIPYYYLSDEDKVPASIGFARTYTGNSFDFGDVIAEIPAGNMFRNGKISQGKICFYGIAKTQYWTSEAKQLFKDCVGYALIACNNNDDCTDGNSRTQDTCNNPGTIESYCSYDDIACLNNADCGSNRFVGNNFCSGSSIVRDYVSFSCNNPGTISSSCSNFSGFIPVQQCDQQCQLGECIFINCTQNSDCNDLDERTVDQCVNPNTTASYCINSEANCLNDLDCGITGFIEENLCFQEDIFKYYQNSTCYNPGALESSCSIVISPRLINDCDDSDVRTLDLCLENPARCENRLIECNSDLDCSGGSFNNFCSGNALWNNLSVPLCLNPGTINSDCSLNFFQSFNQTCAFGCDEEECLDECEDGDTQSCDTGLLGVCASGLETCSGGEWGSCIQNVQPGTEVCDGLDNDCDGTTDEGCGGECEYGDTQSCYSGPAGTLDVGICQAGLQTCDNGSWGNCVGEIIPIIEVCDGLDNDCDGSIDEEGVCGECEDSSLIINMTYFANYNPPKAKKIADISDNVYVAGSLFGIKDVKIPLTSFGLPIVDPVTTKDVPGLFVFRGSDNNGNYVEIVSYGNNHDSSRESFKANIEFENSIVSNIINPNSGHYGNANDGKCGINTLNPKKSKDGNDEIDLNVGDVSGSLCSTTASGIDRVLIYYDLTSCS